MDPIRCEGAHPLPTTEGTPVTGFNRDAALPIIRAHSEVSAWDEKNWTCAGCHDIILYRDHDDDPEDEWVRDAIANHQAHMLSVHLPDESAPEPELSPTPYDLEPIARAIHATRDPEHRRGLTMCAAGPNAPHSCWAMAEAARTALGGGEAATRRHAEKNPGHTVFVATEQTRIYETPGPDVADDETRTK